MHVTDQQMEKINTVVAVYWILDRTGALSVDEHRAPGSV